MQPGREPRESRLEPQYSISLTSTTVRPGVESQAMATKHQRIQRQHADDYRDPYYEDREVYEPPPPPPPPRRIVRPYTSHVITADRLARSEPRMRQFLALLIWLFSLYGTVLSFGGLMSVTTDNAALAALITAILYQAIVSVTQFITCKHWTNPLYLIALFASVIPSFIGYRQYTAVPATRWLFAVDGDVFASWQTFGTVWQTDRDLAGLVLAVHIVAFVGFILVDIIPERIFIQHR